MNLSFKKNLLFIFFLTIFSLVKAQVPAVERDALIALYNATDGPNWSINTNWNTAAPVDTWFGVTVAAGTVTELRLNLNGLSGFIPPEIGDLINLTLLDLHFNRAAGAFAGLNGSAIPATLGNLTNLVRLDLSANNLAGNFPIFLTTLPNLEELELGSNLLTGVLPPEVGDFTSLRVLSIGANDFSGDLPIALTTLLTLENFGANSNNFTGGIPPAIGNMVNLERINLDFNNITGTLPVTLGNLINLEIARFGNNLITGPIPIAFANLGTLIDVNLNANDLTGTIPPEFSNNPNLRSLTVRENNLSGTIPNALANLISLRTLWVSSNELSGTIPNFTTAPMLNSFLINGNNFQFGDFEDEHPTYAAYPLYDNNPQVRVDAIQVLNQNIGDNLTFTTTVSGLQNHYEWFKDGIPLGAPDNPTLTLNNIQLIDAGIYHCEVTSDIVTDLTIERNTITLNIAAAGAIPFVTTWQTTVANETITIPTIGGGYDYTVDWGDGTVATALLGDATHMYTTPNIYTVSITGDFPRIFFNDLGDKEKIVTIEQWGDNPWTSMSQAFEGCTNLQGNFTDVPDLSLVDNMSAMFSDCVNYNTAMNNWDVSNVTDMSSLFLGATIFNSDISNWDVSNVTSMSSMFNGARAFNQDISNWQTANVTTMQRMFFNNEVFPGVFNNDIEAWNVSNVTDMSGMFQGQELFNQDIGNWNVAVVADMERMFSFARSFNQDIGFWNVSNVTTMEHMFSGDWAFNQDLNMWNVSMVTNMESMFTGAIGFNSPIGNWDVSNVITMEEMFASATIFNQDIGAWDVTNVTTMEEMFRFTTSFDQDIGDWNVINLTNAIDMFEGVTLSISNYDSLLIGWNALNLQPNVTFSGGNSQFCLGESARTNMITTDFWDITDAGFGGIAVDDLVNQIVVDLFVLPAITGINLTGNEAYYTGPNGTGAVFLAGDVIAFDPAETYPITLYIYDATGECESQEDFELTITSDCDQLPIADVISDVTECAVFVLPALSPDNTYYTATNAGGTILNAGDIITTSQTIFIYTGVTGCFDESSFSITIDSIFCENEMENTLPNFFTPNGDSVNDLWDISSIEDVNAQVFIFDRYGKLLIQLNTLNNLGWDGTYQGIRMPSTDYWYRIVLSDGEILQGNFTLKR